MNAPCPSYVFEAAKAMSALKCMTFGWELDQMDNNAASMTLPLTRPILLRSIQFTVAYLANAVPTTAVPTDVLVWMQIPGANTPQFAAPVFAWQGQPSSNNHGGTTAGGLLSVILKVVCQPLPSANTATQTVILPVVNVVVPVATGSGIVFAAEHFGQPGDVEVQGSIYFE